MPGPDEEKPKEPSKLWANFPIEDLTRGMRVPRFWKEYVLGSDPHDPKGIEKVVPPIAVHFAENMERVRRGEKPVSMLENHIRFREESSMPPRVIIMQMESGAVVVYNVGEEQTDAGSENENSTEDTAEG